MKRFMIVILAGAAIGAAILLPALLVLGCSGGGEDDDTGGESPEETTPQETIVQNTVAPATPFLDQLGPYVVRDSLCSVVNGEVVASGDATVSEETEDVLCSWGGTLTFPFYSYSCQPGVDHIPGPGEWVPYTVETGYYPEDYGESPDDSDCVLCSADPEGSGVCYLPED